MFQKTLLTCCIVLLPLLTICAQNMTWEEKLSDKYKLDVPRTDGKPTITAATPIAAAPLSPEARLAYLAEQSRRVEQSMAMLDATKPNDARQLDATKPNDARQLDKYRKTLATFEAEKLEINKKQKPTKNK